jgi:hypothetical protein
MVDELKFFEGSQLRLCRVVHTYNPSYLGGGDGRIPAKKVKNKEEEEKLKEEERERKEREGERINEDRMLEPEHHHFAPLMKSGPRQCCSVRSQERRAIQ